MLKKMFLFIYLFFSNRKEKRWYKRLAFWLYFCLFYSEMWILLDIHVVHVNAKTEHKNEQWTALCNMKEMCATCTRDYLHSRIESLFRRTWVVWASSHLNFIQELQSRCCDSGFSLVANLRGSASPGQPRLPPAPSRLSPAGRRLFWGGKLTTYFAPRLTLVANSNSLSYLNWLTDSLAHTWSPQTPGRSSANGEPPPSGRSATGGRDPGVNLTGRTCAGFFFYCLWSQCAVSVSVSRTLAQVETSRWSPVGHATAGSLPSSASVPQTLVVWKCPCRPHARSIVPKRTVVVRQRRVKSIQVGCVV